ncbi:hypothetical protein Pmani_010399 [Petrolisthes manimaculis]|uniref:Uncharacterized protein n=1 Tax=Petrolisthes manimaculis TaxID=1843537 RepID=A0AAE1Q275_9EUCA|nr:hypothetical protein Pmani_010399 [Petrolisthes manimaculis]
MSLSPTLMALVIAVLVAGTVKFGTMLGSLILLHVILTPSDVGRRLRLELRMEARRRFESSLDRILSEDKEENRRCKSEDLPRSSIVTAKGHISVSHIGIK